MPKHRDPTAADIPTFWQNAIDAANAYLNDDAREDMAMLGQGSWRRFLWSAADRHERAHGRRSAERMINDACRVLGLVCRWVRASSDIYARRSLALDHEARADLVLFVFRRVENRT